MGACQSNNKKPKHNYNKPTVSKLKPKDQETSFVDEENNNIINNINFEREKIINEIIKNNDLTKLRNLIESGEFNVNSKILTNRSLLMHCVIKQADAKVIEYLLFKNANINDIETETGNTCVFFAALDLNEQIIDVLLKYNPNLQHLNNKEETVFDCLRKQFGNDNEVNNIDNNEEVNQNKEITKEEYDTYVKIYKKLEDKECERINN